MPNIDSLSRCACAALLLFIAGCGGSSSNNSTPTVPTPSPGTTTAVEYSGIFGNGIFTGTVTMSAAVTTVATTAQVSDAALAATATATGTAKVSGAAEPTITLSGTYDTVTSRFALTGGGFTLNATVSGEAATGTIITPAGSGTVAALHSTNLAPAIRYCGKYTGHSHGNLNLVLQGSMVRGVAAEAHNPQSIGLTGSVSGETIALNWAWETGHGYASGQLGGSATARTYAGVWANTDNHSGTWSVNNAAC